MNDLISVIIPVYNCEEYLRECVESVLSQSHSALEIIAVNDGSTDGSGALADELAAEDARIKVFHKENGGPSSARNLAISKASGKYIFCIDSDDCIEPGTLETLFNACEEKGAQMAVCSYKRFSGQYVPFTYENVKEEVLDSHEATKRMTCDMGFSHSSCAKLYLASLWEGVTFPEGKIYEDYQTTFRLIAKSQSIVYCDAQYYCYRIHTGSIMRSGITRKNLELIDISEKVTDELTELYPQLKELVVYQHVRTCLRLLKNIMNEGRDKYPETQQRIVDYVRQQKNFMLKSPDVKTVDKIKVGSLCISRGLFHFIYKVSGKMNNNLGD